MKSVEKILCFKILCYITAKMFDCTVKSGYILLSLVVYAYMVSLQRSESDYIQSIWYWRFKRCPIFTNLNILMPWTCSSVAYTLSWKNAKGHIELPCYFNTFLSIQLTYYFNYIVTLTFSLSFDLLILASKKTRLKYPANGLK